MKKDLVSSSQPLPVLSFVDQKAWSTWLKNNHSRSSGVMLKFAKKTAGIPSVTYAEALEEALCFGWIDGRKDPFDDLWWLQRFTPRGPKSIWSQINREKATALITAGRMKPAGLAAIEQAKRDGHWQDAYASQKNARVPEDLQYELDRNPKARAFFDTLNSGNRYAILFRLHQAKKTATRERRLQQFVQMLERGEKLHP